MHIDDFKILLSLTELNDISSLQHPIIIKLEQLFYPKTIIDGIRYEFFKLEGNNLIIDYIYHDKIPTDFIYIYLKYKYDLPNNIRIMYQLGRYI